MNAFQIFSCVTEVEETRPDSGLRTHGLGELAASLVTLVESCKQEFYQRDTLGLRSQSRWPGACCIV